MAVISQERTRIDSSPRREVITSPVTPTWSPRSTSAFQSARDCSPTWSSETITWISASASRMVAKHSLPPVRESSTRPATATLSPVAASGSRPWNRSRTSAIVAVRG